MPLPEDPLDDFVYVPSNLPTFWVGVPILDMMAAYWTWLETSDDLPLFYYAEIAIGTLSLILWGLTFS